MAPNIAESRFSNNIVESLQMAGGDTKKTNKVLYFDCNDI